MFANSQPNKKKKSAFREEESEEETEGSREGRSSRDVSNGKMFHWKHREDRQRAQEGSQEGPSRQKMLRQEETLAEDPCCMCLAPDAETQHTFKSLLDGRRGGFETTTSKEKCEN